jgi:hypothetical protein
MADTLTITYDDVGDILYLDSVKPYSEQETMHLAPDVLGRLHPGTGAVENIEVLFFLSRVRSGGRVELPIEGFLRSTDERAGTRSPVESKPKHGES